MVVNNDNSQLPSHLEDYGSFLSHLNGSFSGLTPYERGKRFASFAVKMLPLHELGDHFAIPELRKESHDGGVDFVAESKIGGPNLLGQVKFTIKGVDSLDNIFSKFKSFVMNGEAGGQLDAFELEQNEPTVSFVLITASKVRGNLEKYENSGRPSVDFYKKLKKDNKITIIDGPEILSAARLGYRKAHVAPNRITLTLAAGYLKYDNAYIAIVECKEIFNLYKEYGDALFLENIRDYLGPRGGRTKDRPNRKTVNQAITETVINEPARMLGRNNGITLRAGKVESLSEHELKLHDASIVNGCQTTMAIALNSASSGAIMVKIVESSDSWDVAKSANFQNEIERIELELARFIRPQVLRKVADDTSVKLSAISSEESTFTSLDRLYSEKVVYEEIRSLFIGLFSRRPNNAIESNYSELKSDILEEFGADADKESLFSALFEVHIACARSAERIRNSQIRKQIKDIFQRFWKEDRYNYRAFLSLLAVSALVGEEDDVFSAGRIRNYRDIKNYLRKGQEVIASNGEEFSKNFERAFKAVAIDVIRSDSDVSQTLQAMYQDLRSAKFENLLYKVEMMRETV